MSLGHHWYPVLGGPAPTTNWSFISASSSHGSQTSGAATTTGTVKPNVGDLMLLAWTGWRGTNYTGATPTDTGSGGWTIIQSFQTITGGGFQQAACWYKVATSADFNSGSGITVTVTGTGGGGSNFLNMVECDIFRLLGGHTSPVLDISGFFNSNGSSPVTQGITASSGSTHSAFTDALCWVYAQINSVLPCPAGTQTFTGTSPATNLTYTGISPDATKILNQYAGLCQSSSTAGSNVAQVSWTTNASKDISFFANFVYT